MADFHDGGTAVRLQDGRVLIAGGRHNDIPGFGVTRRTAEIYDASTGTWSRTGDMNVSRVNFTLTVLPNGKVLAAGGYSNEEGFSSSAEIYDPATGTWSRVGRLAVGRWLHTATLLSNGRVLVAGGENYAYGPLFSIPFAEIYNPATGAWSSTGDLNQARAAHTATLLPNGEVLVAGGLINVGNNGVNSAELYNPASGAWTFTGSLALARWSHTATVVNGTSSELDGKVLVAGGILPNPQRSTDTAELYDPASHTWIATARLNQARAAHTATLLADGIVLVAGGGSGGQTLSTAEIFVAATGSPVANAGGPYSIREGDVLTLNASASSDPDNDPLTYTWDINGDGVFGDATGVTPTLTWAQLQSLSPPVNDGPSLFTVRVQVDDGQGNVVTSPPTMLTVSNTAPTATLVNTVPADAGKPLAVIFANPFDPSAADTAAGFRYSYDLDGDGSYEISDVPANSQVVTFPKPGEYTVNGRIKDKDGGFTDLTTTVRIQSRFDLNNGGSPTAAGYIGVLPGDREQGVLGGFDRPSQANPLLRDGHYGSDWSFSVAVTDGSFIVTVTMGDTIARDRDDVYAEGVRVLHDVSSAAGQYGHYSFPVNVSDGQLTLRFVNDGGDPYVTVNSVEVRPAQSALGFGINPTGPFVADGTTVDGPFTGSPATPNALVTLTTSLGTFAGSDASPSYAGFQAQADAAGNFTFFIRRPTGAGTATITAEEVTGASKGTTTRVYTLPPVRRFDFNGPSNATAAGFVGVRGGDLYSPARGYGWMTAVSEFERSPNGISSPPADLNRDGHYAYIQSGPKTFRIQVNPGAYLLRAYVGDRDFARDNIRLTPEGGTAVVVPNTGPNQFRTVTLGGSDTNNDGLLDVTIADLGGDPYWVLNGLDIAEAAAGLPALAGSGGGSAPSFGRTVAVAPQPDSIDTLLLQERLQATSTVFVPVTVLGQDPFFAVSPSSSTETRTPNAPVAFFRTSPRKAARPEDVLDALFAAWDETVE